MRKERCLFIFSITLLLVGFAIVIPHNLLLKSIGVTPENFGSEVVNGHYYFINVENWERIETTRLVVFSTYFMEVLLVILMVSGFLIIGILWVRFLHKQSPKKYKKPPC